MVSREWRSLKQLSVEFSLALGERLTLSAHREEPSEHQPNRKKRLPHAGAQPPGQWLVHVAPRRPRPAAPNVM